MKKPDTTTVISRETFQQQVWPLPVSELLYVGPLTTKKLVNWNINTIGQLANHPTEYLQQKFGKNGLILQDFARGLDTSPVMPVEAKAAIKSVGNSTTLPKSVSPFAGQKKYKTLLETSSETNEDDLKRIKGRNERALESNKKLDEERAILKTVRFTLYDLRHTFCTALYDAGVDVKTAQYLMGHSNIEITMKIYTHLSEGRKKSSVASMVGFLDNWIKKKNTSEGDYLE